MALGVDEDVVGIPTNRDVCEDLAARVERHELRRRPKRDDDAIGISIKGHCEIGPRPTGGQSTNLASCNSIDDSDAAGRWPGGEEARARGGGMLGLWSG